MNFFSAGFLIFLGVVFVIDWALPGRYRYLWLLGASYFFYASWNLKYTAVLLGVTIVTYAASWFLSDKSHSIKSRRLVLGTGILVMAGLILVFKFWDFWYSGLTALFGISDPAEGGIMSIVAPIGLSFYVLAAIGYLADVHRDKIPMEKNFGKLALFLSFFPAVLSGPIERGTNLLRQINSPEDFDYDRAKKGILQILYGYFMKILVANRLAVIVDSAFAGYSEQTGATMTIAVILYGIQLYADFAGYSYIAIGIGRALGFDLIENFRQPYFSRGIGEFWSRWHISLSSWLRDYVYIPLGGNRKGRLRQYINLMITFLISGLWHGTGWQFIFWGGLHGIYQILAKAFVPLKLKTPLKPARPLKPETLVKPETPVPTVRPGRRVLRALFTFALVDLAWLFFKASSIREGFDIIKLIVCSFHPRSTIVEGLFLCGFEPKRFAILVCEMLIVLAVDLIHENGRSVTALLNAWKKPLRWCVYICGIVAIIAGVVYDYGLDASSFIYARF